MRIVLTYPYIKALTTVKNESVLHVARKVREGAHRDGFRAIVHEAPEELKLRICGKVTTVHTKGGGQ